MPEGDSLRRVAAALRPLAGQRVDASSPSPRGAATGVAAAVDGRVLEDVSAVGKHLLLRFDGGVTVRSHLRMHGRWRVLAADARVHGVPWLVLRTPVGTAVQTGGPILTLDLRAVESLGPDLLDDDVDLGVLAARLRQTDPTRPLGEAIQDQRLVAGIGNMWAAEALWATRLHPLLPAGAATPAELEELLAWAREAMQASVGGRRTPPAVYRRTGRPCPRCGTTIRTTRVGDANRAAYVCGVCQRREPDADGAGRGA